MPKVDQLTTQTIFVLADSIKQSLTRDARLRNRCRTVLELKMRGGINVAKRELTELTKRPYLREEDPLMQGFFKRHELGVSTIAKGRLVSILAQDTLDRRKIIK
ncbi:MAG: hypothetical protein WAV41_00290 [Microgenomates group bacterium]